MHDDVLQEYYGCNRDKIDPEIVKVMVQNNCKIKSRVAIQHLRTCLLISKLFKKHLYLEIVKYLWFI